MWPISYILSINNEKIHFVTELVKLPFIGYDLGLEWIEFEAILLLEQLTSEGFLLHYAYKNVEGSPRYVCVYIYIFL